MASPNIHTDEQRATASKRDPSAFAMGNAASLRTSTAGVAVVFGTTAVLVLLGNYLWLALAHGTVWLWQVPVHESGHYTLGQTILYYGHFLREVPTDIAIALFALGAFLDAGAVESSPRQRVAPRSKAFLALAGVIALLALAWAGAVNANGVASAARDLFQYRTRDDLEAFGSHWQFHWLSTLWLAAAARVLVALSGMAPRGFGPVSRIAWLYFLLLTVVFGMTSAIFFDPRYIGHQAREILTHGPVTLLLTLGIVLWSAQRGRPNGGFSFRPAALFESRSLGWLLLVVTIPAYLGLQTITGSVVAAGQTAGGLEAMVAAHFFEHLLDYALVALLAYAGLQAAIAKSSRGAG